MTLQLPCPFYISKLSSFVLCTNQICYYRLSLCIESFIGCMKLYNYAIVITISRSISSFKFIKSGVYLYKIGW